MAGGCKRGLAALACMVAAWPFTPAQAAPQARRRFDVTAESLRDAVVAIGRQGGINIGLTDPALADVRVHALHRETTPADALERLLSGTAARPERIDDETFRIVRRPVPSPHDRKGPTASERPIAGTEIVVRGSKRDATLDVYPGSVQFVEPTDLPPDALARGSDALIDRVAVLSSTHLGPGRDKLFIRGIADSSFTGRNQATVGEYLGDVRLNYNAPDPHLALYDVRGVELLEGPQGTLYGAGALGGILRLEPNEPDITSIGGAISTGIRASTHGGPGYDAAAMVNLPLVDDRLGVRLVGYRDVFGGYIDDTQRGLKDVNRTAQNGLRAAIRYRGGGWTIDVGFVRQDIDSRDGQYAERDLPPLTRASTIAQPFENDYTLGSITLRRSFGALDLSSTTTLIRHELTTAYDATVAPTTPLVYEQDDRFRLFSNETRLVHQSGQLADWLLGIELLRSKEHATPRYGPVAAPATITGVDSVIEEASLFGEATIRPLRDVAVTTGGRVVINHRADETVDGEPRASEPTRRDHAFLPTVGLNWVPVSGVTIYARYQEGFRAGGLAPAALGAQRYVSDTIATFDGGIRFRPDEHLSFNAALSYSRWKNIQADLVTAAGFPYVANIGSGDIYGAEAALEWHPSSRAQFDTSLFLNRSRLSDPSDGFVGDLRASLPNIANGIVRIGGRYAIRLGDRLLSVNGSLRYVGRSKLGVGTQLDLRQGDYLETALGASLPIGRLTLSLDATNLLDAHDNVFAFGDPFQLSSGRQITPQAPRTIRFGVSRRL